MKNKDLISIAKKFGTPTYIYDAEKIKKQYDRLINSFKSVKNLKINYAVKALSNISILKYINKLGAGIDTVSIQEVMIGIKSGIPVDKIIYTPNGVSIEEIQRVAKMGVNINIDNLNILEQFGSSNPEIPVCIRINPHVMAGGNSKISVGHIDSKFGISIHQIPLLLRIVKNTNIKVNGIHMHTGSDILDIEVFIHAAEILFQTASKFKDLEFIDFGSGFKVPYYPGDNETNIEELGDKLSKRFNEFCKSYGRDLILAFEPGKFLVSEAGNFLCSVNSIKQTTSTVFAQVDTGFNHFVRPMMYGSNHHIENISNPSDSERFYSVVGYICETDTFATNKRISKIYEGNILNFKNAGAYCFSMASNYNSRFKPSEILFYNNKAVEIRKRENIDDLLKNQIELEF
ncbi:MAG: diaminopimelate decarboxylase [Bacteroidetes bacterium]|jgi:diaminopimelate decarboxylase|nr:MAG: diaminopimelate decarboxylase [Cryomorphaceae bacterium BACL29 MAG-121220-bin8]MDA0757790.1 diaminopimelate decarboxylase [Bacteroidota bacterium]MDA1019630.1 diaminopimelate decarboxylase [Bacteroidota bacterium]|tara:strand:+ start:66407 stop:67612 length:1206 start_codon:yes stop_codon:yes gene_type:complete